MSESTLSNLKLLRPDIYNAMLVVRGLLESSMSDAHRLELIDWLTANMCMQCGRSGPDAGCCECWNDQ